VVVAVPTCGLAVLAWYTIPEPKRGITEKALQSDYQAAEDFEYEEKIDWEKTKKLIKIKTNLCVILQGMPGSLPWGMLLVFFNDFLAQQKHFSVPAATLVVSIFGIGGGVGIVLGGIVGQWLYNRRRRWMPLFTGLIVITSTPPMLWLVNDPLEEHAAVALACIAVFMGGFSASACGPSIRAMIMNVNEPETRGVALALHVVLDDLGKGLGPAVVAVLITGLGRQFAFSLSVAGWIPCGLMILGAYFTLEKDEDDMQARLRRNHARAESERSARASLRSSVQGSTPALPALGGSTGTLYGSAASGGGNGAGGGEGASDDDDDAFGTRTPDRGSPGGQPYRPGGGGYKGYGPAASDDEDDRLDGSPLAMAGDRGGSRSTFSDTSTPPLPPAGISAGGISDATTLEPASGQLAQRQAFPGDRTHANESALGGPGTTAGGSPGRGSPGRGLELEMQEVSLDDDKHPPSS